MSALANGLDFLGTVPESGRGGGTRAGTADPVIETEDEADNEGPTVLPDVEK